ncbi:helix-turn-helix transcriptional regulator [Leifsonia sp. C5G2]|uniref:helix-turn-helix domain-containing protein n=1 Tax=Leifsonia sp. C5G2 TaxID=2735269 RepID=UPI0015847996|nr:helix-turn-helix transcriptional regulator [Leifsonia sp. C5G2]NUU07043.1 helix-turn-helix transcriptional regulator [Leifsonia sp. C5G2]
MPVPRSRAADILGRRVREARIALGMSQEDIANLAGMHVTNFGRIERGEANSELHTIVRIATALNVDPAVLMAGLYGTEMLPDRSRSYSVADFVAAQRAQPE